MLNSVMHIWGRQSSCLGCWLLLPSPLMKFGRKPSRAQKLKPHFPLCHQGDTIKPLYVVVSIQKSGLSLEGPQGKGPLGSQSSTAPFSRGVATFCLDSPVPANGSQVQLCVCVCVCACTQGLDLRERDQLPIVPLESGQSQPPFTLFHYILFIPSVQLRGIPPSAMVCCSGEKGVKLSLPGFSSPGWSLREVAGLRHELRQEAGCQGAHPSVSMSL